MKVPVAVAEGPVTESFGRTGEDSKNSSRFHQAIWAETDLLGLVAVLSANLR